MANTDQTFLIMMDQSSSHPPIEAPSPSLPDLAEVWLETLGWEPGAAQKAKFQRLYECILEGNRQLNLTRIIEPAEFWEKHLWDSLRGIRRFLSAMGEEHRSEVSGKERMATKVAGAVRVIDIGTGAGFPGIPVAIAQPTWQVTLLDSTRKKIEFLNQCLKELPLANGATLVDRVERIGQQVNHRETYEIALVRAVAAASVCAEYALPLLKAGGWAVLYRGQWTVAETAALEPVVQRLGGQIEAVEEFKTPLTAGDRHCLYLRKISPTPKEFPRAVGIPPQRPLE
jgi:16S rRNA (guanine527-N7)-methyltransferase